MIPDCGILSIDIKHCGKLKGSKSNLVYTSLGDNSKCARLWDHPDRQYDLIASYYGDSRQKFAEYSGVFDFLIESKGSKFQNFFKLYRNSDLLDQY